MIFAPNYVRNSHCDVIDHIDEVKARTTVFAYEDEVHFFSALDSTAAGLTDADLSNICIWEKESVFRRMHALSLREDRIVKCAFVADFNFSAPLSWLWNFRGRLQLALREVSLLSVYVYPQFMRINLFLRPPAVISA